MLSKFQNNMHLSLNQLVYVILWGVVISFHIMVGATCSCPCSDTKLCEVVTTKQEHEIFMFTTRNTNKTEYELYDWTKITTLALTKYTDDNIMCYGHSKGTRIVLMVSYPGNMLLNATMRGIWVSNVTQTVVDNFMDGAHLDFEDFIETTEYQKRGALHQLFFHLYDTLKHANPNYQVSIDFGSAPNIPQHSYGYSELMKVADFAFIRTYGERRWINPSVPCYAWATDANNVTIQVLKYYEHFGIPANKLILGFGWYGFDYECTYLSKSNRCYTALYKGRCSCASAIPRHYVDIVENLVPRSIGGPQRDVASGAPFLNYKDPDTLKWRQVWYNDPVSLKSRYALADKYGLLGVGAWILIDLDYSDTPEGRKIRRTMFDALPHWKKW